MDQSIRDKIQASIDILPNLTAFGVGIYGGGRGMTRDERERDLREGQAHLLSMESDFVKTCEWLESIEKRKTINPNHSSYGLKHLAEKSVGYITNGLFIAAAIHCGFKFKIRPGSPNAAFNMSEKSLRKKEAECRLMGRYPV
jgi:hypothetical protein